MKHAMRMMRMTRVLGLCLGVGVVGCGGGDAEPEAEPETETHTTGDEAGGDEVGDGTSGEEGLPPTETAERPTMSAEDCEAQGGELVGDIGDGAIHRPDYRCPSGQPPVATVPLGIEGSVCCMP